MAKKVIRIKRNRVKKKNKTNIYSLGIIKKILIFFIFLLIIFTFAKFSLIKNTKETIKRDIVVKKVVITPYPTIKVSPTPVPLVGFCLKVPILTYHHIQPEGEAIHKKQTSLTVNVEYFDKQMSELLASGYTPIYANELINALTTHSALPGKPIMVTMDDGYADNYIYALPILKKYNIKANLMLSSGLVGSNADMLTWDEIREMKSSGLFYFTNHTWSHQSLIRITKERIDNEVDTAKTQIEQYIGQQTNIFTYPYGEFNNNVVSILQSKGYVGAFTTIPGVYQCDSFIMTLHRYHIGNAPLSAYGI